MKTKFNNQKTGNRARKILFTALFLGFISFQITGQTWASQVSGAVEQLTSVYFTHKDTGHVTGAFNSKILRTVDGGLNWTQQVCPAASAANNSVFFINGNTGYIAGRDFAGTCEGNRIMVLKTTNAGTNWNCVITGLPFNPFYLRGVHFPSINNGFAVGDQGTIITTANAGATWANQVQSSFFNLRSVYFTSVTNGFAVGFNTNTNSGLIINTTNGGALWNSVASGTNQLNCVFFTSPTTGYIVGNGGVILKTTNSGALWSPLVSGTAADLNGVHFINANTGYIAGAGGLILKTTNGGANWSPLVSNTIEDLYSVHFPAPGFGYAVGANGKIIKSCPVASFSVITNTVCAGTTINFTNTAEGGNTYVWKDNIGPIALTFNASKTYTVAGSYTVTLIANNGTCSDSIKQTITVNPLPTVTIAATSSVICAGQSSTLTASGASTYSWNTGAITAAIAVTPSVTITYTVIGTNGNGCSNSSVKTITVNALPIVNIAATSSVICAGQSSTLTASGASTYSWNTGAITAAIAVTPSVTITYTVIGTNGNGCINSSVKTITVNALPIVNIAATGSVICAGQSSTLTASGASTYSWNTGAITAAIAVTPSVTITYTVIGTNGNGCSNSSVKTITVNALPTVNIAATGSVICAGQSSTLTASGASTYSWNTGAITAAIAVTPSVTSTYTVIGTNGNGCSNSSVKTITVNALPTVSITSTGSAICAGQTATLTASGANTYSWSNGSNNVSISVSPSVTATYTVTGTNGSGCSNSSVKTITVNSLPNLTVTSQANPLCAGQVVTITAAGAQSYSWSNGFINPGMMISFSVTTTLSVTGTDVNGCANSTAIILTVNPVPVINIASTESILCEGQTATLSANGANTYSWSTGSNNSNIAVSPTVTTTYTLSATAANGCSNTASYTQSVSICSGISEAVAGNVELLLFPNPNNGSFTIKAEIEMTLFLVNELGQIVERIILSDSNNKTIQINNLKSGIYFIHDSKVGIKNKIVVF